MRIACIILAAGLSSRMGQSKLLLAWCGEQAVIAHVAQEAYRADFSRVIVVTGNEQQGVEGALQAHAVEMIHNPAYASSEMLTSLQTGLRVLDREQTDAVAVLLGDLPLLDSALLNTIIASHRAERITIPTHEGKRGHPVIFDRLYWDALLALPQTARPAQVMAQYPAAIQHVTVASDAIYQDMDTPAAYQVLLQRAGC